MAAAVQRGAKSAARSRPKAQSPMRGPSAKRARGAAAGQAKPAQPERAGLPPALGLALAGAAIAIGLGAALIAAHKGPSAPQTAGMSAARQLARLGFSLKTVDVQGAPPMAKADILRAARLYKDQPILAVDLDGLRQRIEAVGWVKSAKVVRLLPDTLVIAVVPRHPLVVWQYQGAVHVVDGEGKVIAEADPAQFAQLPLVVGQGAGEQAAAILPLLRQRPKLMTRIEALVRVDARRWDLRLKDGAIVQLPAVGEDSALIQLDQLDQKARLLELGFERIDLRDPDMVAVRPKPGLAAGEPVGAAAARQ